MKKRAFVFIADGFEEIEAIATIDILRRAGIDAQSVSIHQDKLVNGAHYMTLLCDKLISEVIGETADLLVLPGGLRGDENVMNCQLLHELLLTQYEAGRAVAAICAAAIVLGQLGILKGHRATCYPGFENQLNGAVHSTAGVEVDGKVITGKGPAYTFDFALALVRYLLGEEAGKKVSNDLLYKH